MNENEPPEWFRKATQDVNGLIRTAWPIIRASQFYIDQAMELQAKAGSILESGVQAALAMDAGMAELNAAVRELAAKRIAASANFAATPKLVVDGDVASATESMTVIMDDGSGNPLSRRIDVVYLGVIVLWLVAVALPLAGTQLTPEQHQILSDYIATVSLAVILTWRLLDNRKR